MKYAISTITDNNNINQTIFFLNSFKKYNSWFDGDILIIQKDYELLNMINQQRIINVFENNIVKFISSEKWKYKEIIKSKYPNNYSDKFNEIVYCKLEILDLLDEYNKIIYFDTDIIINKDLSILFQENDYDLECSIDTYLDPYIRNKIYSNTDNLDINDIYEEAKYFCAGFMVFNKNVKNEFEEFFTDKILNNNIFDDLSINDYKGYNHKFLDYGEQDIFNLFYRSNNYKINYLPIKYHFLLRDLYKINNINDCAIIHYTHIKLHKDINKALRYKFYINYFKELFPTYIICKEEISKEYKKYYINLGFKDILNDIQLLPKTSYYIELKNNEYLKLNKSLFEIIYNMFYNQINKLNLSDINKIIYGPEQNLFINEINESNLITISNEIVYKVDYKIDYILSYIDFEQLEIQNLYKEVTGKEYKNFHNSSYLDLELVLKLILKNLPFINKLYITCKDVQKFPDNVNKLINGSNGKIVRMNESRFMPNKYISFSASCIEMFLWKIPGLSEHFIYGNDDMLPLKPLTKDMFFNEEYTPIIEINQSKIELTNQYRLHTLNENNLIFDKQDDKDYQTLLLVAHTIRPLTKTICKECFKEYKKFIMNSLYPVRYFNNFTFNLYVLYGFDNGLLINEPLHYDFKFEMLKDNLNVLTKIKDKIKNDYINLCDLLCINDNMKNNDKLQLFAKINMNYILNRLININES